MKKLHKFLALAVLAPMLAACAPSSEDVCNHVVDLLKKEYGGDKEPPEEELKKAVDECVKDMEKKKEKIGAAEFKTLSKCAMAAEDMKALSACEKESKGEEDKKE